MKVVENRASRRKLLSALLISIVLIACALNLETISVKSIYVWARVAIPASLLVGLVGAVQTNRPFSIITAVISWVGIGLFFLVAILTLFPGEWARLMPGPQAPSEAFLVVRFALLIMLGALVTVLFFRLTKVVGLRA